MSFTEAIQTCLQKYATFDGRARRSEYWYWTLASGLANGLIGALFSNEGSLNLFGILLSLALFIPSLSVLIRRMHDIGKSGWAILIALVPLVGAVLLLVWECTDSQPGDNAYGPNPKENPAAAYAFVSEPVPPAAEDAAPNIRYPSDLSGTTCPACGAPLKAGQKFCEFCGTRL